MDEGSVIYDTMDHRFLQDEDIVKLLNALDSQIYLDRIMKETL